MHLFFFFFFLTGFAFETDRHLERCREQPRSICPFFHAMRMHVCRDGPDKNHAHEGGVHKLWHPPCLSRGVPIGRAKKQESIPRLSAPTRARFSPQRRNSPLRNTPFLLDDLEI